MKDIIQEARELLERYRKVWGGGETGPSVLIPHRLAHGLLSALEQSQAAALEAVQERDAALERVRALEEWQKHAIKEMTDAQLGSLQYHLETFEEAPHV